LAWAREFPTDAGVASKAAIANASASVILVNIVLLQSIACEPSLRVANFLGLQDTEMAGGRT
jgi:hypothetical protein